MNLDDIRRRIDAIDRELLGLLNRRADLVHEVGLVKKRDGLQIYAPDREESMLRRLVEMNRGRLDERSIRAIYREIMSAALSLEDHLRIACLGPEGAWTHQAARKKFGSSVEYLALPDDADVFDHVERRVADYGVVAVEHSSEGTIGRTLDLFIDSPLRICAQILLRIDHCLVSAVPMERIRTVHSHPQALAQCRSWLRMHLPQVVLVECASAGEAARIARERADEGAAAVAGSAAAALHGLEVHASSIQDRAINTTRFLVIGEKTCPPTGCDRTSLIFAIDNRPGALARALSAFDRLQVNLSRIESRPARERDWEYVFHIDLAGHCEDSAVAEAIDALRGQGSMVKLLGSYADSGE
ncbi:MAG: prephenate dehydratase [Verrucomicrobia bacterium]|nr:prephenate dehydratase [Verrucomicrobiota bacterium]